MPVICIVNGGCGLHGGCGGGILNAKQTFLTSKVVVVGVGVTATAPSCVQVALFPG